MVLPVGLDTPRTDIGNATYLTNPGDLDFSREQSFQSPSRANDDLVKQIQNSKRGISLKTPRSRVPFGDRRNVPVLKGEFTPLLKSVTKSNLLRNQSGTVRNGNPFTPGFLRQESIAESPALPAESSGLYGGGDTASSFGGGENTPVPQVASSSAASTPLAMLPRRDGGGVLADGAAMMTLKEQENIINKVEKENFGLKLKIHFLEEALRKSGPGYSEAALKENTELKVDKVTMQKELQRYRKTLGAAERDIELYRQQIVEIEEKMKRKHADEGLYDELDQLRRDLEDKEAEVQELRQKLEEAGEQNENIEKLKDDIGDLEASLREKDRIIDEREDEIDSMRESADQASNTISQLEQQLAATEEQLQKYEDKVRGSEEQDGALKELQEQLSESQVKIQDLEETIDRLNGKIEEVKEDKEEALHKVRELEGNLEAVKDELEDAKEDRLEAFQEKERAEADLNELRDEMANKSFSTKGLSRQLEEKAHKLSDDLEALREEHAELKSQFDAKVRDAKKIEEKLEDVKDEEEIREQKLKDDCEMIQHERDIAMRERDSLSTQLQKISDELRIKTEEKDLLQSRHEALTAESSALQKELNKAKGLIQDLENKRENEKQMALNNERAIHDENKAEIQRLTSETDSLRKQLQEEENRHDHNIETWGGERRALEAQRDKAEEKAAGLAKTIAKLQEVEGTLSGRELKLQQAVASEKERHNREEAILNRQIEEVQADINNRRCVLDGLKTELNEVKEEFRVSKREKKALEEKVQSLEDEVEVLQSALDEEGDHAKEGVATARAEAEGLRRQLHSLKQDWSRAEAAQADHKLEVETLRGEVQAHEESKEQLAERLRDVEGQLGKVKKEKQALQDQLAKVNIQMHNLRTEAAEIEAERDEIRSQLQQNEQQVDVTVKLDSEKLDLRRAKMKLETDVSRLRGESKLLQEKNEALEKELDQEIAKAEEEEAKLNSEITRRRKQLSVAAEGKDKEINSAKRHVQRLELRISELEEQLQGDRPDVNVESELSIVRRDLSAARAKEAEYLQREASQKDIVRQLKRKIADMERNLHEIEMSKLAVDSPKSSVSGSARKAEILEVRRQLLESQQQVRDLRVKAKEAERNSRVNIQATTRELQAKINAFEDEKGALEKELLGCRHKQEEEANKNIAAEQTIGKLRTRVQFLEKQLHEARIANGDRTMAEERKDLHEMLKEARLEVEDLQIEIGDRDSKIESLTLKEKDLHSQLKRVREERSSESSKAKALMTELENVQRRYERALDKSERLQTAWEAERKAVSQRVRFPNTSISSVRRESTDVQELEREVAEKETRHQGEIKGLVKQIQYLRSKCQREETFRSDLAYSKKFFLMQIELYNACNHADLRMIEEMGISPDRSIRERRPRLRSVALMVLASVKMKRMQQNWSASKKLHASLAKTMERVKRRSKKSIQG